MTNYFPPNPEAGAVQGAPYPDKASGMAVTALVLGILSFCCCGFIAGIPALILGYMENGKIGRHESSPKGKWMVLVGMILGAISILLSCVQILWIFFGGGLAILQGLANQ